MQATQATTIEVTPSGKLQVTAPQQMRPLTSREIAAIRDRRDDISSQLTSSMSRRNDMIEEMADAPTSAQAGYLSQIQVLDQRIVAIERDMEESGRMLRTGLTVDNGTALVAPQVGGFRNMSDEVQAVMGLSFGFFVLLPIAIVFVRRMWNRGRPAVTAGSAEQDARMERMEQALDAVALEIERVGESQRFQSKVLAEANLMPALPAGQRPAEPIRVKDYEGLRDR